MVGSVEHIHKFEVSFFLSFGILADVDSHGVVAVVHHMDLLLVFVSGHIAMVPDIHRTRNRRSEHTHFAYSHTLFAVHPHSVGFHGLFEGTIFLHALLYTGAHLVVNDKFDVFLVKRIERTAHHIFNVAVAVDSAVAGVEV